jgi:hypothetical protein
MRRHLASRIAPSEARALHVHQAYFVCVCLCAAVLSTDFNQIGAAVQPSQKFNWEYYGAYSIMLCLCMHSLLYT